jgi:hypothetical protein
MQKEPIEAQPDLTAAESVDVIYAMLLACAVAALFLV